MSKWLPPCVHPLYVKEMAFIRLLICLFSSPHVSVHHFKYSSKVLFISLCVKCLFFFKWGKQITAPLLSFLQQINDCVIYGLKLFNHSKNESIVVTILLLPH